MWQSLLAAFSLGLVGSAHCVGMCGPLVLALPVHRMDPSRRGSAIALYHTGRIGVYALGGMVIGLLGRPVYLAGWQQTLSVLLGTIILCQVLIRMLRGGRSLRMPAAILALYNALQRGMAPLWHSPSPGKFFLMGIGNGLLPCGMVYLAIAGALTTQDIAGAVGFMAFFGVGTLPMLLFLQATGRLVSVSFRQRIRNALPYLTAFMAILLILRGMNLGIPFVSPMLPAKPAQIVSCH
ncbi:MAG: sulfite exporter TauE/SafE family protein [Bacteroidota bacterium]|nr:sulfite exporter TauE/SafE family protein [Bacteroidota bacterium]MDP4215633.1 sulfite exporter TauE/SafE family protein [Bacteroidota bacterium]MDP4245592.1 sulfite exporter TauE/SafE family protein [Bacteroidota bacterium]MDP4253684.1 sulfite exporter TauE/SafE family protein [Bacteroidota bacterium]MDP4259580.1 sulfite exporter TauE/SafE family protein [Bacteroidota bacterium]